MSAAANFELNQKNLEETQENVVARLAADFASLEKSVGENSWAESFDPKKMRKDILTGVLAGKWLFESQDSRLAGKISEAFAVEDFWDKAAWKIKKKLFKQKLLADGYDAGAVDAAMEKLEKIRRKFAKIQTDEQLAKFRADLWLPPVGVEFWDAAAADVPIERYFSDPIESLAAETNEDGVTLCSKTTRENLEQKFWFDVATSENEIWVPKNDANIAMNWQTYKNYEKFAWVVLGRWAEQEKVPRQDFKEKWKGNVADIYIDSTSDYEHRAVAFLGADGRMVLDPYFSQTYFGNKTTTDAIPLEKYSHRDHIIKAVFYRSDEAKTPAATA